MDLGGRPPLDIGGACKACRTRASGSHAKKKHICGRQNENLLRRMMSMEAWEACQLLAGRWGGLGGGGEIGGDGGEIWGDMADLGGGYTREASSGAGFGGGRQGKRAAKPSR